MAVTLTTVQITGIDQREWEWLASGLEPAYAELRDRRAEQARGGRPSAYPDRQPRALKAGIRLLMLAAVPHIRHRLPAAQISRLIGMNSDGVKQHTNALAPLFDQFGHPLRPVGEKVGKIEDIIVIAIPQAATATRDVTT